MKRLSILTLIAALLLCALPARGEMIAKAAARVTITPSVVNINDGTSRALVARISPAQAESTFVWTVENDTGVVSVDSTGLVKALKPGSAYVRATHSATGLYARRKVTVKTVRVAGLKLSSTALALEPGEVYDKLTAKISPANATIKEIKWTSTDERVVSVDPLTGALTAVSPGRATITASAGSKKATCRVRVLDKFVTFTLSAAGDVIMGGDPRPMSALQRVTENTFAELLIQNGRDYPFRNVAQILRADDVTIVNLEGTLTTNDRFRENKPHVFRGKPDYAQILKSSGIEVCNLANNHTQDFYAKGLKETGSSLNNQGIKWCDFTKVSSYTVTKNGVSVKIGFAGFQTPILESEVRNRIKRLKKQCDLVVASFHWCDTQEWAARIFPSDRRMAQVAILAGADLVLGHHRHVPAGIEMYQGKYIVYDLANFVVGIKHKNNHDSMIFQWDFVADGTGYIASKGIRVIPCTTTTSTETYPVTDDFGDMGAPINNWQPAVLTGEAGRAVIARIQAMSNVEVPMG